MTIRIRGMSLTPKVNADLQQRRRNNYVIIVPEHERSVGTKHASKSIQRVMFFIKFERFEFLCKDEILDTADKRMIKSMIKRLERLL